MKTPVCKFCLKEGHYQTFCRSKKTKSINKTKRIKPDGKEFYKWQKFRLEVAIPYLDKMFGHKCTCCDAIYNLDIDHIINKGSNYKLKYELSNLQYLCRACHFNKTNGIKCNHSIKL